MALIANEQISRRWWLRQAGAMATVFSLRGAAYGLQGPGGSGAQQTRRWAWLSDTHIPEDAANEYRGFRPVDNLEKVTPQVLHAKPSGMLINGDVARLRGLPGDYARLKTMLAPVMQQMPVGMVMGNHDDRVEFAKVFKPTGTLQEIKNKLITVIEEPPVRFILLDSLVRPNETPGFLGKAQRTWLSSYLEENRNMPTFIFVHHTLDDEDGALLDADRMLRLLLPHRHVKAVIYGHSHRYQYDRVMDLHLINLPAVGYNFNDAQPVGWVEATLTARGGDLRLHAIAGNRANDGKITSLEWRG
jgi:3',5'-cyclic-AMP phosphodiesterase